MENLLAPFLNSENSFLYYSFWVGVASSVVFGIVGSLVVTKKIASISGSISHFILGGIGIGIYLQREVHLEWIGPTLGAFIFAGVAAVILTFSHLKGKDREDTSIQTLWALGMSLGLIFLSKTKGYVDPMSYLFGNILITTSKDLYWILILDLAAISLTTLFYREFMLVAFDEEYGKISGVNTGLFYFILLLLVSLTIVSLVSIVGIVLVIALLTLPQTVAGQFSKHLWQMMLYSVLFAIVFNVGGLILSYQYDLPSGPTIVVLAVAFYLFVRVVQFSLFKVRK